ncbi:hypothetical protein GGR55DRAFT_684543 [Xylaria sp. FL0064]|nr:hypothetical protein GGR55DRAFT_684543 [Xylaria sp. FL0064]
MPENTCSPDHSPASLPDLGVHSRDAFSEIVATTDSLSEEGPAPTSPSDLYSSQTTVLSSVTVIASSENSIPENATHTRRGEDTSRPSSQSLVEQPCPLTQGRLPLKESLGHTGSVTVFGGSVLILLGMGFLFLLWFGYGDKPEAAEAPWVWRRIALGDWMTRTITILALVLRSVVSFQVALCTSMTAALVLEKRSTRKSDVAYLSIARSLICLLASIMVALQFSSTFLLSDLHDFVIVGDVKTQPVFNFGTFEILNDTGIQAPLLENDLIYAVFGEELASPNITPSASGFSDTGTIRRGYLPFRGSENRTSVRRYLGSTLVTNSRTICVPPQLKGNLLPRDGDLEYAGVGHMVGILDYARSIRTSIVKAVQRDRSDDFVKLGVMSGSDRVQVLKAASDKEVVLKKALGS